jgi:spore coat protein U-like protein
MAFTNYDPVGTHIIAGTNDLVKQQTLTAQCTSGMSAKIKLNAGLHTDGESAGADVIAPARRMKHTVGGVDHYLAYNLHQADGSAATIWGGGASGGLVHTGTGTAANLTIFGRVTAGQSAIYNAEYTDTVIVSYVLG